MAGAAGADAASVVWDFIIGIDGGEKGSDDWFWLEAVVAKNSNITTLD
jgi:hypothetical protein